MIIFKKSFLIASLALMMINHPLVNAQDSNALSDQELKQAIDIEKQHLQNQLAAPATTRKTGITGLAATAAGRKGKTVVTSIVPVGSTSTIERSKVIAPASSVGKKRAVVTRYDYSTGITTRTTIDLGSGKVLAVRSKLNYPTALAAEELEEAKTLLIKEEPAIDKIVKEYGSDKVKFFHLTLNSKNPSDKRYGHRLLWLWIAKPVQTNKYLVDLSTNEIEKIK